VRVDEQRRHKREGWERRRRLADRRSARSDEALAALRHRAEEALATEGMERTRLGYEVLVKFTTDDLLEQDHQLVDGTISPGVLPRRGDVSGPTYGELPTARAACGRGERRP
jgi:hypothetical protein